MKIMKLDKNLPDFEKLEKGDWIDLRISSLKKMYDEQFREDNINRAMVDDTKFYIKKGYTYLFGLGFSAQLDEGCEAYILPRSSTFKNTGLRLNNEMGVVDFSYCGDNDTWMVNVTATRDVIINKYDRLFQFRTHKKMDTPSFEYVETLGNFDRGGFGSTGLK